MKQQTIFMIALVTLGVISCASAWEYDLYGERKQQNCADNEFESWYWTGQQCQQCYKYDKQDLARSYICDECNDDGTCKADTCPDGYSKFNAADLKEVSDDLHPSESEGSQDDEEEEPEENKDICLPCNGWTGAGFTTGEECCFMKPIGSRKEYGVRLGFTHRAHWTKTQEFETGKEDVHRLYGSVIRTIDNCEQLTDYTLCRKCLKGYFVNEKQYCSSCNTENWSDKYQELFTRQHKINYYGLGSATSFPSQQDSNCRHELFPEADRHALAYLDKKCSRTQVCEECDGPKQCRTCSAGYYLGSNVGRETFDRNIAKYASFCKPCNPGCICTDGQDLCSACITGETEGTWYKDEKLNRCFPCRQREGLDRQFCDTCKYVPELNGPQCLSCVAESNDGESISNVLEFKVKRYFKEVNGDSVSQGHVEHSKCLPCYQVYELAGQRQRLELNMALVELTNDQYQHKYPGGKQYYTTEFSTTKSNPIFDEDFKDVLLFGTDDFGDVQNNRVYGGGQTKGSRGCRKCNMVKLAGRRCKHQELCDEPEDDDQVNDNQKYYIHYITCDECNNGYVEENIPEFIYRQHYEYKAENGKNSLKFWIVPQSKICLTCSSALKKYDQRITAETQATDEKNAITLTQQWRHENVMRCRHKEFNKFDRYEMTQCSTVSQSSKKSGTEEPMYESFQHNQAVTPAATYFKSTTQQNLDTYLVDISTQIGTRFTGPLKNLCVENKNHCKKILTITDLKVGTVSDTSNNSIDSYPQDPRCETCFDGFILTENKICKKCPLDLVDANTKKGCIKCEAATRATEGDPRSSSLNCIKCRNNQQCTYQGKQRGNVPLAARSSNYNLYNYFYNADDHKCYPCNLGCKKCLGVDQNCQVAQRYWRRVAVTNEQTHAGATFETCNVDFCRKCDEHADKCEVCDLGFTLFEFQQKAHGEITSRHWECQRCDIKGYCLECGTETVDDLSGTKKCTKCDYSRTFLDEEKGVCKLARANCLTWEKIGGTCLQCDTGYRLQDGWCRQCVDIYGGFYYCPKQCSQGGFKTLDNVNSRKQSLLEEDHSGDGLIDDGSDEPEGDDETPATRRVLKFLEDFDA